jgi:pyrroline-5-carboxylate reductase
VKIGIIGCGFMGEAVLSATLARGVAQAADVFVAEVNPQRADYIAQTHNVRTSGAPGHAVAGADVVIFAIKPQEFESTAAAIKGTLAPGQTVMSIMAGVPMGKIARALGHTAVARVMPNTPAAIGEGMSVWTATPDVSAGARGNITAILEAMGRAIYVEAEKYIDMATALNGSGPGFVYLLVEAFIDAGVHIGLPRATAETLALQTFMGSAKYAQETGRHPAVLRNEVTSPAGTTAAGIQVLEDAGVRGIIIDAIEAAYERSQELGA